MEYLLSNLCFGNTFLRDFNFGQEVEVHITGVDLQLEYWEGYQQKNKTKTKLPDLNKESLMYGKM